MGTSLTFNNIGLVKFIANETRGMDYVTYNANHNGRFSVSHVQDFRRRQEEKIACIINANKLKFRYLNGHKLLQCVRYTSCQCLSLFLFILS